jgi:hypothetical protein
LIGLQDNRTVTRGRPVPKLGRRLRPSIRSRREIVESRPERLQNGREPSRTERWTSSPAEFWDTTGYVDTDVVRAVRIGARECRAAGKPRRAAALEELAAAQEAVLAEQTGG